MKIDRTYPKDIDQYIADFPRPVQSVLKRVRSTIRKAVPGAEELISYRIEGIAKFRANEVVARPKAKAASKKR
ncbi:MAG: hypothetical protein GEV06_25290 [Luteitalea sp.]|nr:hypothetical protein [Luteitalea sp.]